MRVVLHDLSTRMVASLPIMFIDLMSVTSYTMSFLLIQLLQHTKHDNWPMQIISVPGVHITKL